MLRDGDMFGNYRVCRRLGKGGMGEVWLLKGADAEAWFAVKILDEECAKNHKDRRRFVREAQIAMAVQHPNLVRVYDVGEDPDTHLDYILMEYVSGGTLKERLAQTGPMPIRDALRITRAIASVLEAIRVRGIVHRDIKPENIMFAADGTPKLADLGIAYADNDATLRLTVTGSFVGTPAYTSPEQMTDPRNVDIRSDIYSLGIVLFEMLAGRRPYQDETCVQTMARAIQGKPIIDVRNFRPGVPAPVVDLIHRMTASDRRQRIASPKQIADICGRLMDKAEGAAGGASGRRGPAAKPGVRFIPRHPAARGLSRNTAVASGEEEPSSGSGKVAFLVIVAVVLVLLGLMTLK